jgi:hypothetical protein
MDMSKHLSPERKRRIGKTAFVATIDRSRGRHLDVPCLPCGTPFRRGLVAWTLLIGSEIAVVATPPASEPAPQSAPARPAPFALPREKWEACGIFMMNGIPTHSRGDQHAARIISGDIPYDEAAAQRRATVAMLDGIGRGAAPFSFDEALTFAELLSRGDDR